MSGYRLTIKGDEELLAFLHDAQNLGLVKDVVKGNTSKLHQNVVRNAQFTKGYSTGTTRRSINSSITNNGLTGTVKAGTHYSGYVEVGTRKMEAQPFVKPAFEKVSDGFIKELEEIMKP